VQCLTSQRAFSFDADIQQRFEDFDRANPKVYRLLVYYARAAKHAGKRVGIRAIWERMRWEITIEKRWSGEFKLNDHLTSRYARKIMEQEPDLADFFETRKLRA
jgi:hypothetical protein